MPVALEETERDQLPGTSTLVILALIRAHPNHAYVEAVRRRMVALFEGRFTFGGSAIHRQFALLLRDGYVKCETRKPPDEFTRLPAKNFYAITERGHRLLDLVGDQIAKGKP